MVDERMSRVTDCGYRDHTLPEWNYPKPLPDGIIGICDCGLVRYVLEGDSWVNYDVYESDAALAARLGPDFGPGALIGFDDAGNARTVTTPGPPGLDEWAGNPR